MNQMKSMKAAKPGRKQCSDFSQGIDATSEINGIDEVDEVKWFNEMGTVPANAVMPDFILVDEAFESLVYCCALLILFKTLFAYFHIFYGIQVRHVGKQQLRQEVEQPNLFHPYPLP